MLPDQREQSLQNLAAAKFFFDRQQPDFTRCTAVFGQIRIELREFLVERKRSMPAHGQHADQTPVAQTDRVGIFRVKFIHQPPFRCGAVLRDFLDERFVIELVNEFEFPVFGGNFKFEGRRGIHMVVSSLDSSECISRSGNISVIASARFRRCATTMIPAATATEKNFGAGCSSKRPLNGSNENASNPLNKVLRARINPAAKNTAKMTANCRSKMASAPMQLATPLPPRKPSCTGQT